ncbi:MAG: PspC domain-containing protein [Bacteroidota bacterium]
MKTTVNINLNKQAFIIDEDAFHKLNSYIQNIKARFNNEVEANEVIEDIEARIAELFSKKTNTLKPIVDINMVDDIIQKLGRPEDIFMEDEAETKQNNASQSTINRGSRKLNRKLFRNPDDKKLAGLISGISLYLGFEDTTISRIVVIATILLLMFVTKGSVLPLSIIIYIILSMVIPLANTASEKLQMRGEDVNLNNIKNNVVNEMNKGVNQASNLGQKIVSSSRSGIKDFFSILGKLIAGCFVFSNITSLFFSILVFIVILVGANSDIAKMFATSVADIHIANIGLLLVGMVPSIAIIYFGLRWILGNTVRRPGLTWVLLALFIIGSIIIGFEAAIQVKEWHINKKVVNEVDIKNVQADTIFIYANHNKNINNDGTNFTFGKMEVNGISKIGDDIFWQNAELDIEKGDHLSLTKKLITQGSSDENALDKIRNIHYNLNSDSNSIHFDDYYSFPVKDKFRAQKVKMLLEVPVGKVIYLDISTKDFIYDIDNVTNTYDKKMVGHYWIMTEQGLKCLDKIFKDENADEEDTDEAIKKDLDQAADSLKNDLKNAENVNINIDKDGLSLKVDKKDGSDSKIIIKDNNNKGADIKIEKNGVEEKVIHIKDNK